MNWTIPGTTLQIPREDVPRVPEQFQSMFLAGGMVLSQVAKVTGLAPHTVQNWVKRGFLAPPVNKRYSLRQLCRIININMLRGILPMERICMLLGYVNGQLDDENDDIIDDAELYFMFVRLASHPREIYDLTRWSQLLEDTMSDYQEPFPGARDRVSKALQIMLTAWGAARLRQEAERHLEELEQKKGK